MVNTTRQMNEFVAAQSCDTQTQAGCYDILAYHIFCSILESNAIIQQLSNANTLSIIV